jgi:LPS-assembly protein
MPGIGYSDDDGLITKNPFFWAINRSSALPLYPQTYAKRGIRFGAKYRYVLNEQAKGDIMGSFISDKMVDDHPEDYPDADKERWSFGFHHFQTLKDQRTTLKADVNLVSDNEFLDDFPDTFSGAFIDELDNLDAKSDSYLRSLATATHKWDDALQATLTVDSRYYETLVLENNDDVLQLLPEVTFSLLERPLAEQQWLLGRMEATYDHFWRQDGERGHRIDLHPALALPVRFGPLEVMPFLSLRETAYSVSDPNPGVDDSSHRETLTAGLELKGVAERVYVTDWWGMDRMKHTLEPTVTYRYVPDVDQDDLPSFDWLDYRPEESNITYALVSRLVGRYPKQKAGSGGPEDYDYHEWLKFQIGQSYSFIDVADGWRFLTDDQHASDWFSQLEVNSRNGGFYMKLENRFDPYTNANNLMTALLSTRDERGDFLSLEYRYERDLAEVFTGSGRVPLWSWLDVYGSVRYSIAASEFWETLYGFNLHPQCWALDFAVDKEYNPDDLTFRVLISLNGLGSLGNE